MNVCLSSMVPGTNLGIAHLDRCDGHVREVEQLHGGRQRQEILTAAVRGFPRRPRSPGIGGRCELDATESAGGFDGRCTPGFVVVAAATKRRETGGNVR